MDYSSRPARIQANPEDFEDESLPPQTGTVFNIWYNKWSGGSNKYELVKSKYKLNIEQDSGFTKANKSDKQQFFCLYFAKGMCVKGKNCQYLHRIPNDFDIFPITKDCFGREKFNDYRDDMTGVGSFNHVNTTLFIGNINKINSKTQNLINEIFKEFGKIKKINLINNKNCCFITFKNESSAQFAKEAMNGQSLFDDDTILSIKWANDDPNPNAIKLKKREFEEQTQETIRKLLNDYDNKKQKIQKDNEPVIEEPEEPQTEEKKEVMKLIEEKPNDSTIFNKSSLNYLHHLKPIPSLVSYDSDSD